MILNHVSLLLAYVAVKSVPAARVALAGVEGLSSVTVPAELVCAREPSSLEFPVDGNA